MLLVMSGHNSFLMEFIKMRKELSPMKDASKSSGAVKLRSKVLYKKDENPENNSLAEIIEKKPHKRVVIEYLQERANAFTVEKMS